MHHSLYSRLSPFLLLCHRNMLFEIEKMSAPSIHSRRHCARVVANLGRCLDLVFGIRDEHASDIINYAIAEIPLRQTPCISLKYGPWHSPTTKHAASYTEMHWALAICGWNYRACHCSLSLFKRILTQNTFDGMPVMFTNTIRGYRSVNTDNMKIIFRCFGRLQMTWHHWPSTINSE